MEARTTLLQRGDRHCTKYLSSVAYLLLRSRHVVDVVEGKSMRAVRPSGADHAPILWDGEQEQQHERVEILTTSMAAIL